METDKPEDDTDRMTNAIHLYCSTGAKKIEELSEEIERLKMEINNGKDN